MNLQKLCVALCVLVQVRIAVAENPSPFHSDARSLLDGWKGETSGQGLSPLNRRLSKAGLKPTSNQGTGNQPATNLQSLGKNAGVPVVQIDLTKGTGTTAVIKSTSFSYFSNTRSEVVSTKLPSIKRSSTDVKTLSSDSNPLSFIAYKANVHSFGFNMDLTQAQETLKSLKTVTSTTKTTDSFKEMSAEFQRKLDATKEYIDLKLSPTTQFRRSFSNEIGKQTAVQMKKSLSEGDKPSKNSLEVKTSKGSGQSVSQESDLFNVQKTQAQIDLKTATTSQYQRTLVREEGNIFTICDVVNIDWMIENKQIGVPKSQAKTAQAYSYIDLLNLDTILSAKEGYREAIDNMRIENTAYAVQVKGHAEAFAKLGSESIHVAGAHAVILRGQSLICKMQERFSSIKIREKTDQLGSLGTFYGIVVNYDISEDIIEEFGSRFTREEALFLGKGGDNPQGAAIAAMSKQITEAKLSASATKLWTDYWGKFKALKVELCLLTKALIGLYASSNSPNYRINHASTKLASKDEINDSETNRMVTRFFGQFQDLLLKPDAEMIAKKCGNEDGFRGTLQEIILGSSLGLASTFMKSSITFFSETFFKFMLDDSHANLKDAINFDLRIVSQWTGVITIDELTKIAELQKDGLYFHVQFFDDLFILKVPQINQQKQEITVEYNLGSQFVQFLNLQLTITDDLELPHHYFKMVYILYQLYCRARLSLQDTSTGTALSSASALTRTSTLQEIYTVMYHLLKDYDFDGGYLRMEYLLEVRAVTLSYICSKIDKGLCEEAPLKVIIPKLVINPDVKPLPKPSIWARLIIIMIIRTELEKLNIQTVLDNFETTLIKIITETHTCKAKEEKSVFRKVATENSKTKTTQKETTTTTTTTQYYVLTPDCTSKTITQVDTHIKTTIKDVKSDFDLLIRRLILIINGSQGVKRDLIQYIIIRIITIWIKEKPSDVQLNFIIKLFQELEEGLLRSGKLDLTQTAGVYFFSSKLVGGASAVLQDWRTDVLKNSMINRSMLKWDIFYLGYIAGLRTNPTGFNPEMLIQYGAEISMMRNAEIPRMLSVLDDLSPINDNALKQLEMKLQQCRANVLTKEADNSEALEGDCDYIDGELQSSGYLKKEGDRVKCKLEARKDYKKCDLNTAAELVQYLFTIDVAIESVHVFDSENLFSNRAYLSREGQEIFDNTQQEMTVNNHMFLMTSYQFLQMIRNKAESGMQDVPNYVLRNIVNCLESYNTLTKVDSKACPFDRQAYGAMFWTFRHSFYQRKALGGNYDLSTWDNSTPMGTTFYIQNMAINRRYAEEFQSMCETFVDDEPEICLIAKLVLEWMDWVKTSQEQELDRGFDILDQTLGFSALIQAGSTGNAAIKLQRRRFLVLEALNVIFYLVREDGNQMEIVRNTLNYKAAANGELFETHRILEFSFAKDSLDIDAMAKFLQFTYGKTVIKGIEDPLVRITSEIYAQSTVTMATNSGKQLDKVTLSLLGNFISFLGSSFGPGIRMMAMYGQTPVDFKKLAQELYNIQSFLDVATAEFNYETMNNLLTFMIKDDITSEAFAKLSKEELKSRMELFLGEFEELKFLATLDTQESFQAALGTEYDYEERREAIMQINEAMRTKKVAIDVWGEVQTIDFTSVDGLQHLMELKQSIRAAKANEDIQTSIQNAKFGSDSKTEVLYTTEETVAQDSTFRIEKIGEIQGFEVFRKDHYSIEVYQEMEIQKLSLQQEETFERVSVSQQRRLVSVDDYLMPSPRQLSKGTVKAQAQDKKVVQTQKAEDSKAKKVLQHAKSEGRNKADPDTRSAPKFPSNLKDAGQSNSLKRAKSDLTSSNIKSAAHITQQAKMSQNLPTQPGNSLVGNSMMNQKMQESIALLNMVNRDLGDLKLRKSKLAVDERSIVKKDGKGLNEMGHGFTSGALNRLRSI